MSLAHLSQLRLIIYDYGPVFYTGDDFLDKAGTELI